MPDQTTTTRTRILEAAGEVFGMEGFKAATIRKIAEAANANIAAIHYYFGDKERLYAAALENIFSSVFQIVPAEMGMALDDPPRKKLKAFIDAMFYRLLYHKGWTGLSGKGRFIAREMIDPTPALEPIIEKYLKPQRDILVSIISEILGPDAGLDKILPCAISIVGQCVYFTFAAPIIQKIAFAAPTIQNIAETYSPMEENLDHLSRHVWNFSLGGIQRIKEEKAS
jgi:AcrR family transcriptional regulator